MTRPIHLELFTDFFNKIDPYATSFVLCEDEDRKRRLTLRQAADKTR